MFHYKNLQCKTQTSLEPKAEDQTKQTGQKYSVTICLWSSGLTPSTVIIATKHYLLPNSHILLGSHQYWEHLYSQIDLFSMLEIEPRPQTFLASALSLSHAPSYYTHPLAALTLPPLPSPRPATVLAQSVISSARQIRLSSGIHSAFQHWQVESESWQAADQESRTAWAT